MKCLDINPLYTGDSQISDLANSEDQDGNAASHQVCIICKDKNDLRRQKYNIISKL